MSAINLYLIVEMWSQGRLVSELKINIWCVHTFDDLYQMNYLELDFMGKGYQ